jgi:hypothetical protein
VDVRGGRAPNYGFSERIIRDSHGLQVLAKPNSLELIGSYRNVHAPGMVKPKSAVQTGIAIGADRKAAPESPGEGTFDEP